MRRVGSTSIAHRDHTTAKRRAMAGTGPGHDEDQPTEISEPWSLQYDSFEEFYLAPYGMVFRVASLILHDTSLAEEVTHEVFLELLRGRTHFDPARGALRTWVLTIARHRAVDRVRQGNGKIGDLGVRSVRDSLNQRLRIQVVASCLG
jgi:DNA-directed RNA polymerase specialized sigma24 family protein